ncbi:acyltransferase-domain-containing protein [Trichocladium antarcticum]|uniref:1-acyl-sn-glycerol-3-phosphate acyltransferase n=1 Tax=Trichocladium antarcticum TaxID=1450529 RepID=A0AAN6US72_9PEZI|nr:acyltransferase-domain-containing protein [Trichocladium antarcticum]
MAPILAYLGNFFLAYIALIVAFFVASVAMPKAAFVARALISYLGMLASSFYGVVASIALRLVGYGQCAQWATGRSFKYFMLLTGVTFYTDDPKDYLNTTRPAVFVANHQTEVDVLMLGCIFPKYCSMTAKASLARIPLLGWFMTLSGAIFLNRADAKSARQKMSGAADEIRTKRQSVFIFPEGTRSYSKEPTLLPFKKGAFHLAVEAQVPIVPIVVANYSHVFSPKALVFQPGRIPCKVLDPIPTTGLTSADVDDLTRSTRELMLAELVALTEKARGRAAPTAVPVAASGRNGVARATGVELRVPA